MLKNYLKIAFRNIRKNPLLSFINVFGLALSLTVAMMVTIRTQQSLSVDRFHILKERIYRITSVATNDKELFELATSPLPLQPLLEEGSEVEKAVMIYTGINGNVIGNKKTIGINGAFTNEAFLQVFNFPLQKGDPNAALSKPFSMVLSKSMAERFFGSREPIGQTIEVPTYGLFTVTGVLDNPPGETHLDFDLFASTSTLEHLETDKDALSITQDWNTLKNTYNYVLLKKNTNRDALIDHLHSIEASINRDSKEGGLSFNLQRLDDISPTYEQLLYDLHGIASWGKIYTEIGIALLILFAACFNYINLTIARALSRGKEVGIRKIAGALRFQIFFQYVLESMLIALLALVLAYGMLGVILKYQFFNSGYKFLPDIKPDAQISFLFLCISIFTGLLAGVAPAWILSAFKPVNVLKNVSITRLFGSISLQKSLIVFQFTLSLVIIIFLTVFYRQFQFMAKADTGFRKDHLIRVPLLGTDPALLVNEFKTVPGVTNVTRFSGLPGNSAAGHSTVLIGKDGTNTINTAYYFSDSASLSAFNLQLLAGENFNTAPVEKETEVLINETAVKAFHFGNNSDAIGKAIWLNDSTSLVVRGVVKDFYYGGIARRIEPLLFRNQKDGYWDLYVQTKTDDYKQVLSQLEQKWKLLAPYDKFQGYVLTETLDKLNDKTADYSLIGFLAFMTVFIASFGLLGLVIYAVETRKKEISVRKVIGATVSQLMILLSRSYVRLLLIAAAIALPIGFTLSFFFLQNFANRVMIGWDILLVCVVFLLIIMLSSIVSQTYKASMANPADNLRAE